MLSKYDNCTHLFKIKNKLKIGCCYKNNFLYFVGIFNKTIILLALVGYEMIIANSTLHTSLAIYQLISTVASMTPTEALASVKF